MAIYFFYEDCNKPKIKINSTKAWIKKIIESHGKKHGNINYIFCNDDYLLKINSDFLAHNYYTDIITFNYCEGNTISGDIFISLDRINENAEKFNSKDTELYRVMAHGILHLIGFDDHSDNDKKIMRMEENMAVLLMINYLTKSNL